MNAEKTSATIVTPEGWQRALAQKHLSDAIPILERQGQKASEKKPQDRLKK
jgi:hypothetical protein